MNFFRVSACLLMLALGWSSAFAQTHVYSVYVDQDNNPATGCSITTAAGTVSGIEAVLSAEVPVDPVSVSGQHLARCQAGVLQPAIALPGAHAVGFDQGPLGFDVIELGAPLQAFGQPAGNNWRLVFGSQGALLDGADLTDDVVVVGLGHIAAPTLIPSTSLFALALLALILAVVTIYIGRRRPQLFSILLVTSALGLSGLAWAASHLLDGSIGEWPATPQVTDPADDATAHEPPIDIRQGFAAQQGGQVYFRIDVSEIRLSELLPTHLQTQFSIAENSANGNVLGAVISDASGLGSLLSLSLESQAPAPGFDFDPVSSVITVTDSALLDFETRAQFQLGLSAALTGLPGFTWPVSVLIDIEDINETPVIAAQSFTVVEHTANGSALGTVAANDPDAGTNGQLTYAVTGGSGQALFALDPVTAIISVADSAALDPVASPYSLDIMVSDAGSPALSTSATMTIALVDVNDAPIFIPGGDVTVNEDSGAYDAPWASAVSDGDDGSQALAFQITSNDNPGLFALAPTLSVVGSVGQLAFTPAADANGIANLTVVLRDDGGTDHNGNDQSAAISFRIIVSALNDAPILTVPGVQEYYSGAGVVFSTANANAISVADVDAGDGINTMTFSSTGGVLVLANPDALLSITDNDTALVSASGTLADFNTALNGPDGQLLYTPTPGDTRASTLSITLSDQGHSGAGGALDDSATIEIDAPPVISASPAAGIIANNAVFSVSFSEPVDVAAGTVTLDCGSGNLFTGGDSGSNVTSLSPTYAGALPEGVNCELAVDASGVSDSDGIDPPDQPSMNFSRSYTTDAAPTVTATTPFAGQVVGNDVALMISFSEPVTTSAGAVTLDCAGPIALTDVAATDVTSLTPGYTAPLPSGGCTLTIVATQVSDSDLIDPPDVMVANHVVNFSVDAAPTWVSATPDEAAVTGSLPLISFSFDEAVNDLGGAIVLDCGEPIAGNITGDGTATLTFTPAAPLTEGASCTATAVALSIGDSDDADPPEHPGADVVRQFTIDTAPTVLAIVPADGAVDVGLDANITVSFSETVNFTAAAFSLACPDGNAIPFTLSGDGTDTATIEPIPVTLPIDTLCVFAVNAALVTDVDTADLPDAGSGVTTVSFTTVNDHPPSVIASTPANGDTVANDAALAITFSEPVDVAANAVTLTCGGSNLITGGASGSNTVGLTPTYTGPLPSGTCTLTVLATHVTDVDTIDPPDEMLADHVVTFAVDAAPTVVSTSPANGTLNLPIDTAVSATFSEAVTVGVPSFTFACDSNPVPFSVSGSDTDTVTLTPAAPLPAGVSCTVTALAAGVEDVDIFDPPGQMESNYLWTFTIEAAPAVTSTVPGNGALVNSAPTITVNFSEAVNLDSGVFLLDCNGVIATTPSPALPANGITSIDFTPDTLPAGANCTATVLANAVHDADSIDPPDTMEADYTWSFSVDATPSVVSITPADGSIDVNPTSNIVIEFSEPVNFDTTANAANTSFALECPSGAPVNFNVVSASPATSVVLDSLDNAVAGRTCTLTVRAAHIHDVDTIDPPDEMAADVTATFSFGAIATDDSVNVTPHLSISTTGGAINLATNDILGTGQITDFGFGGCAGTAPGSQLDAGVTNGRLTLAADGSFSYDPPAAVANETRTFCYTVTGGDTANVTFNIQTAELVWFVDAAALVGGIGTQARPFRTLAAVSAVDTPNDTIFLAFHDNAYAGGITLKAGARLIGHASGSTLAAITGITPVGGSAFPALGGSAPTITCGSGNCIALDNSGGTNTHILRGFTVGDAGADGTKIAGTTFGTMTVADLTLNGIGRALRLSTGTLNGNFSDIDVSSGSGQGISLDAVGGTWSVTNQVSIANVDSTALNIINTPAGGSTSFAGGLSITKPSPGPGISLNANAAPISLGTVAITTNNGAALVIDNSSGITSIAGGNLNATAGPALNASTSALAITLTGATSSNSTTQGINLASISGTVAIGSAGGISGPAGTAFLAQGTLGNTSYGGAIGKVSAGRLVDISGPAGGTLTLSGNLSCTASCGTGPGNQGLRVSARNAGTITFSGASKIFSSSVGNPGVSLTNNTGATINFSGGGLAITTANGAGFEATGGGTISVQDGGNTIGSTTGTALNVANTTIAAAGLNFQSISSNGGPNGIVLNTTGALGGLTVTGVASAATGGTIQNKATGIFLTNTLLPSFSRMQLNGFNDFAIRGTNVSNFTLADSVINGVSGDSTAADEGSIYFTNLSGAASIINTSISGGFEDNFKLVNNTGTLNRLIFSNVTIGSNSVSDGNDGISLEAAGPAVVNVTVENSNFTASRGDLLQYNHIGTGNGDLVITGSNFSNSHPGIASGGGGVTLNASGLVGSAVAMSIIGNNFRDAVGDSILIVKSPGEGTFSGTFSNNTIGVSGTPNSGSREGNGIRLQSVGQGALSWTVSNNLIYGYNGHGIEVRAGGGAVPAGGTISTNITGNVVAEPGNTIGTEEIPKNGIHYNIGTITGDSHQVCANIGGAGALANNIHASGKDSVFATVGDNDFRIRNRRAGVNINFPGFSGASTAAGINAYLVPRNSAGGTPIGLAHGLEGTFTGSGTTCP